MTKAKRTDPKLWETVKDEFMQSDKGGKPGQWSARKAQLAVQEYRKRGGDYADDGPDQTETDLHEWTEEDWGTASGNRSLDTGERYLPKAAREAMSDEDYRRTTEKKRADLARGQQFSAQPDDVAKKAAKHRNNGQQSMQDMTKDELMERAQAMNIEGRSQMNKDELADALAKAAGSSGQGDGDAVRKADLEDAAKAAHVNGASSMKKDDLRKAIRDKLNAEPEAVTKDDLRTMADQLGIHVTTSMNKDEMVAAVRSAL